jgi:cell division protease FtsH
VGHREPRLGGGRHRSPLLVNRVTPHFVVPSALRRDRLTAVLLAASIAIVAAFVLLLGSTLPASRGTRIGISQVLHLTDAMKVRTATILDDDDRIVLHVRDGRTLWAQLPSGGGAQAVAVATRMTRSGALVDVDGQAGKRTRRAVVQYLLPVLLLICLFALFTRLGGNDGGSPIAAFSRRRTRARRPAPVVTFADVAGAGEAVAELREICDYLAHPQRYARLGARAPRGVLLVGPSGTGKTLLARATAGEAGAAFLSLAGSEFAESPGAGAGAGATRVRDLFENARRAAPAIIFIDELDVAGRTRGPGPGEGHDERERTLNQLLLELDGFDSDAGIVVIGATNQPDILAPALLRPGRFDRQITVDVPDRGGRTEILELYLATRPIHGDGVDAAEIAALCPGFTGADLASVVNEASLLAVRRGRWEIGRSDLEEAIGRVIAGPARRSHVLSRCERHAIAIHEASRVVVAQALGAGTAPGKVSIVARGPRAGSATQLRADRARAVLRESDLLRRLVVTMAGAAGERIAFGEHATTVQDDLHAATQLARSMVTSLGMSALGSVTIGEQQFELASGASSQDGASVGPRTLEQIDLEVRRLVEVAERRAEAVLRDRWADVELVADVLEAQETLSGQALATLVADVEPVTLDDLEDAEG